MADYYTQFCFGFTAPPRERVAILAANELDGELFDELDWSEVDPTLREFFPEKADFQAMFDDDDSVNLNVDITYEGTDDLIVSAENPYLDYLINVLWAILKDGLDKPIGFEWANTCSKGRPDAFGGGCCVMFKDRVEWANTTTIMQGLIEDAGNA